jgi:oxygen-independent coproporphyrinogen-3 oxidase
MTTPRACRSLYLHVPLCRTRCGYCDFYSEILTPGAADPLVDALLAELAGWTARGLERVDTLYVGGGTPTVLPRSALARLLGALRELVDPHAPLEFTVEANPVTVSDEIAATLVEAGVNRVSIGAQSFDPGALRALDRTHQPEHVHQTVATCRRLGIARISLDVIFGIPGQTLASWQQTLETALALEPEHVSAYGLTYEPGTVLTARRDAGKITPIDEDIEADMYEHLLDRLPAAGLRQYEISNFARAGGVCRHNLRYWHNEPCIGVGPSAAGFVDDVRYKNVADTAAYIEALRAGRSARAEEERLTPVHRVRESAMLALRLVEGIDRAAFAARFGVDPVEHFADAVTRHRDAGLLTVDRRAIRLTRAGFLLANRVMRDFL